MNRLLRRDIIPPGGQFRFRHFETGFTSTGGDYDTWINEVVKHRMANNLPWDRATIVRIAEEQMCSTLPPGWCAEFDPNRVEPLTRVTWGDIYQGMQVFARWFKEGRPYVIQEEAERRAEICSKCYLNVNVEGCGTCHELAQFLSGDVKTSFDPVLASCGVCKCLLKAAVHFPINTLEPEDSSVHQQNYPAFCWRKIGGENYENND
jgi:hypothetical protein